MSSLVSVMMPCYNAAARLPTALTSLLEQSYQNWECLLVDDGSTDNFAAALRAFDDPRIRVFRLETNYGRGYAHALALKEARGEFLCTVDADDWIYAEKLDRQVRFLQDNPSIRAVSSAIALVDEQERLRGIQFRPPFRIKLMDGVPPRGFCFGAAMLRREDAVKVGYDATFRRSQDFDFFCRLLAHSTYAVLPDVTYAYHYEPGSSLPAVLEGLASNRRFYKAQIRRNLLRYAGHWAISWAKTCVYQVLYRLSWWESFQSSRRLAPTHADQVNYQKAYRTVMQALNARQKTCKDLI